MSEEKLFIDCIDSQMIALGMSPTNCKIMKEILKEFIEIEASQKPWKHVVGPPRLRLKLKKIKTHSVLTEVILILLILLIPFVGYSFYQSFEKCNGIFGDRVVGNLKWHKNYKKFDINYRNASRTNDVLGSEITFSEHPWLVRIINSYSKQKMFKCTGFFVSDEIILTAAHCLTSSGIIQSISEIRYGGTAKNNFSDSIIISKEYLKIIPHPKYDDFTKINDIGIIKIINYCAIGVYPIRLPISIPEIPTKLKIISWLNGNETINRPEFKESEIEIWTIEECEAKSNKIFVYIKVGIFRPEKVYNRFCADVYIERGDSGSPIFHIKDGQPVAYGIVSIGAIHPNLKVPGIFTNIYPYLHWILCNGSEKVCEIHA